MTHRSATCSCGQLNLMAEGEPVRISMCHCLDCQRRTGSVFGAQAWFPRDRVQVRGESKEFRRVADSGNRIVFHFCPNCGSTVYYEPEAWPDKIGVAIGAFADPAFPPPRVSVYESRMHPWVRTPDGAKHFDESRYLARSMERAAKICGAPSSGRDRETEARLDGIQV